MEKLEEENQKLGADREGLMERAEIADLEAREKKLGEKAKLGHRMFLGWLTFFAV